MGDYIGDYYRAFRGLGLRSKLLKGGDVGDYIGEYYRAY